MKKIFLMLVTISLAACSGDAERFLNQAHTAMCKVESSLKKLQANPSDAELAESIKTLQREIDTYQELSGYSKEKFSEQLGKLMPDCPK